MSAFFFIIKSSFQNFWRSSVLSLSVVSVLSVTLFSILAMVFLSLLTETSISIIHKKVDFSIELREGISLSQVDRLLEEMGELEFVESTLYISKDDALDNFKENYEGISSFLTEYKLENPLYSSIEVVTLTPEYHQDIIYFLSQDLYKDWIDLDQAQQNLFHRDRLEKLINFTDGVKIFAIYISIFFVIIAFLIIFNTIRILIFHRKDELELMYLL
ncbi:MAG: permease-like cell division protein FtsX [Patescibacteria group bacterium]|nr:permease-like cell division protein FtsX [Patescibacteria group bacterium]